MTERLLGLALLLHAHNEGWHVNVAPSRLRGNGAVGVVLLSRFSAATQDGSAELGGERHGATGVLNGGENEGRRRSASERQSPMGQQHSMHRGNFYERA